MTGSAIPCPKCKSPSERISEHSSPYSLHKYGIEQPDTRIQYVCPACGYKGRPAVSHRVPDLLGRTVTEEQADQKARIAFLSEYQNKPN